MPLPRRFSLIRRASKNVEVLTVFRFANTARIRPVERPLFTLSVDVVAVDGADNGRMLLTITSTRLAFQHCCGVRRRDAGVDGEERRRAFTTASGGRAP